MWNIKYYGLSCLLIYIYLFKKLFAHFLHLRKWSLWIRDLWQILPINPVLLPFVLPVPLKLAMGIPSGDGTGQPKLSGCPACAEMQQAELASRQDSFQAVPRGTRATHSTYRTGQGIQNPVSENGAAGTSELCRKLQILLGCLCCPYSEQSELSCFKNLHCCKAEDNRGAHLCKMLAEKGREYCLHVPLLCPAQYWTRSDQLRLFALFCSGNKKVQGNPEQNV